MTTPGKWTFFFSWGCTGSYSSTVVELKADGTWTAPGFSGMWVTNSGMFILNFKGLATIYAGNVVSSSMTGISATFTGAQGCWYALKEGAPLKAAAKAAGAKAAGAGFGGAAEKPKK